MGSPFGTGGCQVQITALRKLSRTPAQLLLLRRRRAISECCCLAVAVALLLQVRTMQEHWDVWRGLLVRDVAYQAPIIAAYDR